MEKIKMALEAVQHIYLCEDEGMASGQPTKEDYLEARKLVAAALSELEGSQPKEQPRYVMSGLAKEAMEVRHEFAAFILDRYGVTDHAELRTHIDSLLIMFDQLVEHPKEQGAEPVAWMRRWAFDKNEGTRGNRPPGWNLQAVTDSRMLPDDVPLFATAPTSREKAMEEAGEEVIKAYRGFHEAIEQYTGKPYPWDPIVSAIEKWTTAKSTK